MQDTRLGLWCLVACFLLALAGCYESLTSIATADKVVFYDDLVGEYKATDPAAGRLTLKKGKDKTYSFLQYDQKDVQTSKGALWLVKLGNEHFYQVTVDGYARATTAPSTASAGWSSRARRAPRPSLATPSSLRTRSSAIRR